MSSQPRQDFGVLLNLAFHAFKEALHADLCKGGFDDVGTSFGYVFRLLGEGPLSLRTIAQHLAITSQGALKILVDMEAKGYVIREEDRRDRRLVLFRLTERAVNAMTRAKRFHKRFEAKIESQVGQREISALRRALEAITSCSASSMANARPM
jgi:DNA-binding MarR family transcriptional regulator